VRRAWVLTAIIMAALLTTPVGGQAQSTKLKQAGFKVIDLAVPFLAQAKGFFKRHGVDWDYVEIDSGKLGVSALLSRNVQFVDLGVDDVAGLQKEGKDPILVYSMVNSLTMDLVVRNDVLGRLGVRPFSPLPAKLKALKGLSFGITRPGAVTQLFPQYLLRKAGYNPEKDATFVQIGGGQALVAAMKARKIDAFMLSAPAPYLLERDKVGTVLIKNSAGQGPKEFADFAFESIATLKSWALQNSKVVEAYVKSLNEANAWMRTNRDEAVRLLKAYFPETDEGTLRLSFNALIPAVRKDGKLDETGVRNQIDVLKAIGAIDYSPDTKEGVLWTNHYHR
jgi:NitT/TauT family transport system substrate-binding protein